MPTYGYECLGCKEQFEVFQKITDAPLTKHDGCGGDLRKLLYPVGIVFKGPGFHVNDYARKGKNGASDSAQENKTESKPDAKTASSADTKSEAKSDTAGKMEPAAAAAKD